MSKAMSKATSKTSLLSRMSSTSKMQLTSITLSKYNTVNKERNKIRDGVGAVSNKDNKKICKTQDSIRSDR